MLSTENQICLNNIFSNMRTERIAYKIDDRDLDSDFVVMVAKLIAGINDKESRESNVSAFKKEFNVHDSFPLGELVDAIRKIEFRICGENIQRHSRSKNQCINGGTKDE